MEGNLGDFSQTIYMANQHQMQVVLKIGLIILTGIII